MTPLSRHLNKAVRILLANEVTKILIDLESWRYGKSETRQPIQTRPILHLDCYSVVNNRRLLVLLKRVCYTSRDTRAGWIGAGVPDTDVLEFRPLAKWATEHWAMYSGFLPYVSERSDGSDILDVGCGMGHATHCLAKLLDGYTITAIDVDEIAVRFARRFNQARNVHYIQGDFLRFTYSQPYAYIFALEVLEHLPSRFHGRFVDKCLSMLSEKGLLFLTTPNALDEQDSAYAHVGLLNRMRARAFIEEYKERIVDGFFYDNQQLLSADSQRFVVRDSLAMFEDTGRNRSHFCLVMR